MAVTGSQVLMADSDDEGQGRGAPAEGAAGPAMVSHDEIYQTTFRPDKDV